jgi:hypothetical protein
VLVVEDDHIVAMDEHALLDAGFDVVGVAVSADEALAMARAERPQAIRARTADLRGARRAASGLRRSAPHVRWANVLVPPVLKFI